MQNAHIDDLIARYDALLFDAYGVLVREDGALPGAVALIERLEAEQKAYVIVTNDASRQISTTYQRYQSLGLNIPEDRIITSGSLLKRYYAEHDLIGAPTLNLGSHDSMQYARDAGAALLSLDEADAMRAFVLSELPQPDTLEVLQRAISALLRALDTGREVALIVPNPDLIYPRSPGEVGLTAGSAATMIEHILRDRYPERVLRFTGLGKPHRYIYEEGLRRTDASAARAVMIGDQLITDIRGAIDFGMASALVTTGVFMPDLSAPERWPCQPTYLLKPFA